MAPSSKAKVQTLAAASLAQNRRDSRLGDVASCSTRCSSSSLAEDAHSAVESAATNMTIQRPPDSRNNNVQSDRAHSLSAEG